MAQPGNVFKTFSLLFGCLLFLMGSSQIQAKSDLAYKLDYQLEFLPETDQALVTIAIDRGELFRVIKFENLPKRYSDIQGNGELTVTDTAVEWHPPAASARLSLKVKVTHERDPGEYDALMTKEWAIFRGDDLFPAVKTEFEDGAYAVATLEVVLPPGWSSIETGWPRQKGNRFRINNPDRKFDRPTGWMIAGQLGTRRDKIGKTSVAVSAPKGGYVHRMNILTYFNFVWPELTQAFRTTPKKLLVVGMDDPMWRGGLSASNSLFLHADRPLVSENGTSPLIHELTHMVTRISGRKTSRGNDDWIAEGLAEFYSFELLFRAGGISEKRRGKIIDKLAKWGKDVTSLRQKNSTGRITARAVILINELDREIRQTSKGKYSIDDVVQDLMVQRKVALVDLKQAVEGLIGAESKTLQTSLLQPIE